MKKSVLLLSVMLVFTLMVGINYSNAMPIQLHVGSYGDDDGWTGIFDQMQFFANTTTTQYGAINPLTGTPEIGSEFSDDGNLNVTSFTGLVGDDEGLGVAGQTGVEYALTGSWSGLEGEITGEAFLGGNYVQSTEYDPGTVITLYIDDDVDQDFGATVGADDDLNFGADPGTTKVAELTITDGTGTNTFDDSGAFISGSSHLNAEFTWMLDDFWYDGGSPPTDLHDYFLEINWTVVADIDQNTDNVVIVPPGGGDDFLFKILSDHDGSVEVGVIPEPATMFLFGSGLIALAGLGRRRFSKKD